MALKRKGLRPPSSKARERARYVHERLSRAIPDPHCELQFDNPWQLLIAVILSAQSTDKMVNRVLPELLRKWPSPEALAAASAPDVEEVIKSTGFFRNKTKAIMGASRVIASTLNGRVPQTMEELLELPGVARKTANVVLGTAYGVASGIVVDTHAARVAQRLGLTRQTDPEKIERALCALFPEKEWVRTGHRLVLHGRYVCTARAPLCAKCALNEVCPSRQDEPSGRWKERAQAEAGQMASRGEPFRRPPVR